MVNGKWLGPLDLGVPGTKVDKLMQKDMLLSQGLSVTPTLLKIILLEAQRKAKDAFYKRRYEEAEEVLRTIIVLRREVRDLKLVLPGMWRKPNVDPNSPVVLLARAMHKQGKDASAEFENAIIGAKEQPEIYYNKDIAELYLGRSDNLMSRKAKPADPEVAAKVCTEGIDLLKVCKSKEDRKVLADLYTARAEALLDLKKPELAVVDLRAARGLRD